MLALRIIPNKSKETKMKQFKMITFDAYSALLKLEDSMVPIVEKVINRLKPTV